MGAPEKAVSFATLVHDCGIGKAHALPIMPQMIKDAERIAAVLHECGERISNG